MGPPGAAVQPCSSGSATAWSRCGGWRLCRAQQGARAAPGTGCSTVMPLESPQALRGAGDISRRALGLSLPAAVARHGCISVRQAVAEL